MCARATGSPNGTARRSLRVLGIHARSTASTSLPRWQKPAASRRAEVRAAQCCRRPSRQEHQPDWRCPVSEEAQTLRFQHRFRSGAICSIAFDLEEARTGSLKPNFVWNGSRPKNTRIHRLGTTDSPRSPSASGRRSSIATSTRTVRPRLGSMNRMSARAEQNKNLNPAAISLSTLAVALVGTPTIDTNGGD